MPRDARRRQRKLFQTFIFQAVLRVAWQNAGRAPDVGGQRAHNRRQLKTIKNGLSAANDDTPMVNDITASDFTNFSWNLSDWLSGRFFARVCSRRSNGPALGGVTGEFFQREAIAGFCLEHCRECGSVALRGDAVTAVRKLV